jgi:hypothetical protein
MVNNRSSFLISHEELMELCSKSKRQWTEQTQEILKAVMVDGEPQDIVAKRYCVSQQAISKVKARLVLLRENSGDIGFRHVRIHPSLEKNLQSLIEKSKELYNN